MEVLVIMSEVRNNNRNIATILVLFILLVIIACSCGIFGNNDRVESVNERNNGCGCGY